LLAGIGNRQLVEPTAVRVEDEAQIVAEVSLAWIRLRTSVREAIWSEAPDTAWPGLDSGNFYTFVTA
jgi:hypothetical protein